MPVLPFIPRPPHFRRARRFFAGIKRAALVWREPFIGGAALFSKTGVRRFFEKIGCRAFARRRWLHLRRGAGYGRPRCRAFMKRAAGRAMCVFACTLRKIRIKTAFDVARRRKISRRQCVGKTPARKHSCVRAHIRRK